MRMGIHSPMPLTLITAGVPWGKRANDSQTLSGWNGFLKVQWERNEGCGQSLLKRVAPQSC